jgi:hypothetical protein
MRKYLLIAALALASTAAHAGATRVLTLVTDEQIAPVQTATVPNGNAGGQQRVGEVVTLPALPQPQEPPAVQPPAQAQPAARAQSPQAQPAPTDTETKSVIDTQKPKSAGRQRSHRTIEARILHELRRYGIW